MSTTTSTKTLIPEKIYDMLLNARTADKVTVHFKDGRVIAGALIFNPFKGTGRLINIEQEQSVDFSVDDIREHGFEPRVFRYALLTGRGLTLEAAGDNWLAQIYRQMVRGEWL